MHFGGGHRQKTEGARLTSCSAEQSPPAPFKRTPAPRSVHCRDLLRHLTLLGQISGIFLCVSAEPRQNVWSGMPTVVPERELGGLQWTLHAELGRVFSAAHDTRQGFDLANAPQPGLATATLITSCFPQIPRAAFCFWRMLWWSRLTAIK